MSFDAAMNLISGAFDGQDFEACLDEARDLKRELLAQPNPDPGELGWARYYEFKSLHSLERFNPAYELLKSDEPAQWLISTKNVAWIYSVGAELAWRTRDFDQISVWGRKSLESREQVGDLVEVVGCLNTVCSLLGKAGRPDSNAFFASRLLDLGEEHGAERPIINALEFLCDNYEVTVDPVILSEVQRREPWLAEHLRGEFSGDAGSVLRRLRKLARAHQETQTRDVDRGPSRRGPKVEVSSISPNGIKRIYRVLCNLAGSDGEVHPREREILETNAVILGLTREEMVELERDGHAAKGLRVGKNLDERAFLMGALIDVAVADGVIVRQERKRLLAFADLVGLARSELERRLDQALEDGRE